MTSVALRDMPTWLKMGNGITKYGYHSEYGRTNARAPCRRWRQLLQ